MCAQTTASSQVRTGSKVVPACAKGVEYCVCCGLEYSCFAHLEGSVRGPTGERDSSRGEVPLSVICCTSASKLRESFLSRPASLPAEPAAAAAGTTSVAEVEV